MATEITGDQAWGALSDLDAQERESQMLVRYQELAGLSPEGREEKLLAMAHTEYSLPDDRLKEFTRSRIMVWIRMDADDVQKVADSYEAVMKRLPGTMAMRRVGVVQTVSREIEPDQRDRIREIVPNVFSDRPTEVSRSASAASTATPPRQKKPWWAFWRKTA